MQNVILPHTYMQIHISNCGVVHYSVKPGQHVAMVYHYSNTMLSINLLSSKNGSECSFLEGCQLGIHSVLEKSFISRKRMAGLMEQRRIPLLHLDMCHGKYPCNSREVPGLALEHTRKKGLQGEQNPGIGHCKCVQWLSGKDTAEHGIIPFNIYVNKDVVCIRMGKHVVDNQITIFKQILF